MADSAARRLVAVSSTSAISQALPAPSPSPVSSPSNGTIVLVSYHVITISQRMMVSLFAGESMMSTSSTDHVESSLVLHTVYIEICNPIFLRHPPLNLEQFGVLNDCARPTESPPTEFTSTPNYEFDRSPNPPSRCFREHTHHTHTIRKHFEFLLQLRRQITSLESRLLLPEC